MKRKAKREGLALDHYLKQGAAAPTREEIIHLKSLPKPEALALWKSGHSQHCFDYHFSKDGCARDRTCAFLHSEFSTVQEELEVFG